MRVRVRVSEREKRERESESVEGGRDGGRPVLLTSAAGVITATLGPTWASLALH